MAKITDLLAADESPFILDLVKAESYLLKVAPGLERRELYRLARYAWEKNYDEADLLALLLRLDEK